MTPTDQGTARIQALYGLLDELFDADDDLLELVARPEALNGWRQERLGEFCQRVGEWLPGEWSSAVQALAGFSIPVAIDVGAAWRVKGCWPLMPPIPSTQ